MDGLYVMATAALVGLAAAAAPDRESELVARWSFDGSTSGKDITDDSGRYHAVLINDSGGAGIARAGERTVFSIPGTDPRDCLTLGEGEAFDLPRVFTLEAWFRPMPAPPGKYLMILGKRFSNQFQLTWTSNAGGTIEFYVGGGDLKANRSWVSHVPTGRWLHIVAMYDATVPAGPNQWLYLNGACVHKTRNETTLKPDRSPLRLAQNTLLNLSGGIAAAWDEVALYHRVLTPDEIRAAYEKKVTKGARPTTPTWSVPLASGPWIREGTNATSTRVRDAMTGIVQATDEKRAGQSTARPTATGYTFTLYGSPPESVAASWRHDLPATVDLSEFRFAIVRYRALGLQREITPLPILQLAGDNGVIPLLTSSHTLLDGRVHRCLVDLKGKPAVDSLEVRCRTRGSEARLEILDIVLLRDLDPTLLPQAASIPGPTPAFQPLPLPPGPTRPMNEILRTAFAGKGRGVHEPLILPDNAWIDLDRIAFQTQPEGAVLWPEDTSVAANAAKVRAFGTEIPRSSFLPVGRDDTLILPVDKAVSEIYLLLVSDVPALHQRYSRPAVPYGITDVEAFLVDVIYEEGPPESMLPYSVHDEGYRIIGLTGAYVIPVDPARPVRHLVLHNRIRGFTIGLAAATAAAGPPRYAALRADEAPLEPAGPSSPPPQTRIPPAITLTDTGARLETRAGWMAVDWSDGFAIRAIRPRHMGENEVHLGGGSGLDVFCSDRRLRGPDWRVRSATLEDPTTLRLDLESRLPEIPLRAHLVLAAEDQGGILWRLTLRNEGTQELRPDVCFPVLHDLDIGSLDDTWIFFPQYRNVLTAEPIFCRQPNHRGFLMQFMDVFSPRLSGGICLMTRNLEQQPVQYTLAKNEAGVTATIENEGEDFRLPPGKAVTYCDRVLLPHAGDWHGAADAYRRWVATWYTPVKSQDKEWFRRAVWIRSHIVSPTNARNINHAPPIYNPDTGQWRIDEYLDADLQLFGLPPDIVHFYVWAFDDSLEGDVARDGEYGGPDYQNLGGLASFREAIRHLRQDRKFPVSLYTIWDRCNRDTPFYRKYGERFVRMRPNGHPVVEKEKIYLSQGVPQWRDYAGKTLARLQRDTSADILYLDVFGTDDRARCYNPQAGHDHVPTWVAEDDKEFLQTLRRHLPDNVVLWGEFPVPDVASQYWDGFLSYDCIPLHEYMAESYDRPEAAPQWSEPTFALNAFRFLFPHVRQIVFPVGTEGVINNWRYLKFLLFNGQGLFDTAWRLYDDSCRNHLARVIRLQRTFADCFDSTAPETLVPTSRRRVFANRFPGNRRTVWTLFNGRYRTVRGDLLHVPHIPGSTYRDAWNDRPLSPRIEGDKAVIELELPPQGIGCIVQSAP